MRAAESVAGLSQKRLSRITRTKRSYKVLNASLRNKTVPCPVQANHVQLKLEKDLVDMKKCPVEWKGKLCKYILSLMDVFSRYHSLKALEIK